MSKRETPTRVLRRYDYRELEADRTWYLMRVAGQRLRPSYGPFVNANGERYFHEELRLLRMKLGVIVPKERYQRRTRGRTRGVTVRYRPLLGNYFFVGLAPGADDWVKIVQSNVVDAVVCGRKGPYAVDPYEIMAEIYDDDAAPADENNRAPRCPVTGKEYAEGVEVLAVDGVFQARRFEIKNIVGDCARVPVSILGKENLYDVPLDHLRVAA